MPSDPIADHFAPQDNATRYGLFLDDMFMGEIPRRDRSDEATRQAVAHRMNIDPDRLVVMGLCDNHPDTAVVDCITCHPID